MILIYLAYPMKTLAFSYEVVAKKVIDIEARAVAALGDRVGNSFSKSCELLSACQGRIVVTGMGKSGHISRKIAATLASTGSPAFFIHPGEASHGDAGMITAHDVVLALSNSGETNELITLLPFFKRKGIPIISMTGNSQSTLAMQSDIHLDVSVEQEACVMGLAPTSSTTASLVMGDALAIALLEASGFSKEDFALSHPGGSLGRRLLLKVEDLMHVGQEVPLVHSTASVREGLMEMTRAGLGMTAVVDVNGAQCGIFTDGDLRRALDSQLDLNKTPITDVMTSGGKTIPPGLLAAEALRLMEFHRINALLVVDHTQKVVGALNMHDLLRAGVI